MTDTAKEPHLKPPAQGEVQVQNLLCKSCGLCAEYCPAHLMRAANEVPADDRVEPAINPAGHVVYQVYDPDGRCTGCGICASVCPEGAIVVYRRKKRAGAGGAKTHAKGAERQAGDHASGCATNAHSDPLPAGKGEGKGDADV